MLDLDQLSKVQDELNLLMVRDDMQWRQRAKENWLKNGDKNSKYFYACANQRRQANQISRIADERGSIWESQEHIRTTFINYFNNLFTSKASRGLDECLNVISRYLNLFLKYKFF